MLINTRFFNIHDFVLIMAVAAIVHMVVAPLYHRISGTDQTPSSTDTQ